MHEMKLIVDLLHEGGLKKMHQYVSDTAKYGDLTRGPRIIDAHVRDSMRQVLKEVQDGTFAKQWIAETKAARRTTRSCCRPISTKASRKSAASCAAE
jgi:ketol-acid reductoisomerase